MLQEWGPFGVRKTLGNTTEYTSNGGLMEKTGSKEEQQQTLIAQNFTFYLLDAVLGSGATKQTSKAVTSRLLPGKVRYAMCQVY